MKNRKVYNERREEHENASQLDNYMHYNGISFYPSYNMTNYDIKNLRKFYNELKQNCNGFTLDGFNTRAIIIRDNNYHYVLYSYETPVCSYIDGTFTKLWSGYSNTSLKHINIFREFVGLEPLSKYDWIMMPAFDEQ